MAWSATANLVKDNLDLRTYRDVLRLLQRPLDGLTNSIHNMQANVRSLNAVLYEPNEALFKTHQSISDLFEEGKTIKVSKCASIEVQHGGKYETPEDAVLVLGVAVSRIFGGVKLNDLLNNDCSKVEAINYLKTSACEYLKANLDSSYLLAKEFLWVCFPNVEMSVEGFESLFDTKDVKGISPHDRIEQLKGILFTPFKFVQNKGWNPRAIQVAPGCRQREEQCTDLTCSFCPSAMFQKRRLGRLFIGQ